MPVRRLRKPERFAGQQAAYRQERSEDRSAAAALVSQENFTVGQPSTTWVSA